MTFPYTRPVAQPQPIAAQQPARVYPIGQTQAYPPQGAFYFQTSPQQFQPTFVLPSAPQQPQQFGVMQYAAVPSGQQQTVFVPEEIYAQPAFQQISIQQIPGQMRYATAPQQPQTQAQQQIVVPPPQQTPPPPSINQSIDSTKRKNKKESPQFSKRPVASQQAIQIPQQQTAIYPQQMVQQVPQMQQPIQQVTQIQQAQQQAGRQVQPQYQELEPIQQSLENCLPKVPSGFPTAEFATPPGCFNIIRRGNLPGLSFSQFVIQ